MDGRVSAQARACAANGQAVECEKRRMRERAPLEVVAARDSGEYRTLDFVPAVHHLVIAETKDYVIEGGELGVSGAIGLKAFWIDVIFGSIDLDDESAPDQEVDPFSVDPHLGAQWDLELGQPESGNRLRSALADSVGQAQGSGSAGHPGYQVAPLDGRDQRRLPALWTSESAIGHGDRVLGRLTADDILKAGEWIQQET